MVCIKVGKLCISQKGVCGAQKDMGLERWDVYVAASLKKKKGERRLPVSA